MILKYEDQRKYLEQVIIDGNPVNIKISDCIETVPMYNQSKTVEFKS